MKKLIKNVPYEIEWVDTYGYSGWFTEKELDEKTGKSCNFTVGYFVKETKDYLIITMGRETSEDFAPYNTPKWIPKGFIKSIRKLR